MIYTWRPRAQIGIDPQMCGERFAALREQHGGITAEIILNDAQYGEGAVYGEYFQWDDASAAGQYRLDQARKLLRSICVTFEERPAAEPIRAFVVVARNDDQQYEDIVTVMSDAALRQQVMTRAWRELESWRRRYDDLVEFGALFAAIDRMKAARTA